MTDICSTPSAKLIDTSSCPSTPNKKGKYAPLQLVTTPSKKTQRKLPFQLLSPSYENKEESRLEEEYMQLRMNQRYSGSISPLSETHSIAPTRLEETEPQAQIDALNTTHPETIEINKLLNKQLYEELRLQGQEEEQEKERSVPRHKVSKPTRPILKINSGFLNYLVTSSRGSVADATIYATEINATKQPMPMVTSPWEKLTIPVNPMIKSRYSRLKREFFDECDEESDAGEDLGTGVDAAIVRGFAFPRQATSTRSPFYIPKKLRWAK
ncbi:Superficial pseudohyphal growth protein 1 [Nakaseomyces bracarensis]|uniref:Superficial pseudohyphal growth protein 1 n=1 Tax=Nakaseomyces bracarensis TaxID=273131 RepID=A0ABR4NPF9_9SACH